MNRPYLSRVASELRKNGHVVIDGRPCKIVGRKPSQDTISLEGIDLFTGQHHKCTVSTDETVDVPSVSRTEYQLILIDQGLFNLMTQNGTLKDDIKVPTGSLGSNISSDFNEGKDLLVTVVRAMGEEQATSYREA
ncbi:eukaryotic translation initiation factor 5A [Fusarium tricinctum]|uniref:Eukaryotic translation initiation factor 5A n=1 Tax=Fusarium tricinctum TaxID=61284 RepID=A0A8K0RML4_9HYPO|nr:eukaryotic translation initiation factor 5A [Fusarium tricinctum]